MTTYLIGDRVEVYSKLDPHGQKCDPTWRAGTVTGVDRAGDPRVRRDDTPTGLYSESLWLAPYVRHFIPMHVLLTAEEIRASQDVQLGEAPVRDVVMIVICGRHVTPGDATLAEARAILAYAEKFRAT